MIDRLVRLYRLLRYGRLKARIESAMEFQVCEESYRDRKGRIVAYWAYGYFDPNFPITDARFYCDYGDLFNDLE